MHKIGILSDTHGLLRPEVIAALKGCDQILHGGDINKQSILDELEKLAPVRAVRGNNDKEWAEALPLFLEAEVCGLHIYMVHNKKDIPKGLSGVDLVIYGHSHKYEDKMADGIRYLNPGSCGPRRFHQEITFAILSVEEDHGFQIEKVLIPHQPSPSQAAGKDQQPDIAALIPAVMKELDAGKTVKQIAKKHKIQEELAEQIARMYFTHPGIDAEGIRRRMD